MPITPKRGPYSTPIHSFGGVASRSDLGLGSLALRDVAVDQHKAAARHRVAAHLDDTPVGPRVLEAQFLVDRLQAPRDLHLDVDATELAALGEGAQVIGVSRARRHKLVGHIEDLLEIAVPRDEVQLAVEHRHPVAHVVEGDAQFGLTLANLAQEPGIVHCDHRLRGEGPNELDLAFGERLRLAARKAESADWLSFTEQGHADDRTNKAND